MSLAVSGDPAFATETKDPPAPSPKSSTVRDLLTPVFFYRRRVFLALLIPILLAVFAAAVAHPIYVAQSRLLILLGGDYVFKGALNDPNSNQSYDRLQIMHAEMEILSARDLYVDAIRAVGLHRVYPSIPDNPKGLDLAVAQLGKDLTVDNVPQSNVIELTLRNPDPQVAADLLNKVVGLYLTRREDVFKRADPSSIRAQQQGLSQRLAALETQISDFETQNNVGDYNAAFGAVQSQQSGLQSQIQSLDEQIAMREGQTGQLDRSLRATPPVVSLATDNTRSPQTDSLTASLLALQAQRREAADKYKDGYPLVADLDQRIATVQAQLRQTPEKQASLDRRGANPVHQALESSLADTQGQLAGLRDSRRTLQASLTEVDARLDQLVRIGPQYRELLRQRALAEGAYNDLAKSAEDASVANSLSRSQANVRVIQSATAPIKGHSGRLVLLAAGLALACVAALAVVLLSTALSEVMIAPREVEEKLRIPALLTVNRQAEGGARVRLRNGAVSSTYLPPDEGRVLLQMLSAPGKAGGRVLQLVGPSGGEGVSSLALDIAAIAAWEQSKTLLVDVEPNGKGLLAELTAAGHGARPTSEARRTFQINESELFVSAPLMSAGERAAEDRWPKALENARKAFDVVVIASPALARSSAGIELASLADMTLVVVEADVTRVPSARRLIERLGAAGGTVAGAVLNKRRFHIPRTIYSWL